MVLTMDDIRKRYGIGRDAAYRIMREVKKMCGNSVGRGKILLTELEAWEQKWNERK